MPERQRFTSVEVSGFKSAIEPVRVPLKGLTILAGQNSAGKSTVIQPLLLIKQTLEKPFDPGGLAIDGPIVQFTSTEQLLSHSARGRADEFFVKMSSADSYVTMFYRKSSELGIQIDRMEFTQDDKTHIWRERDSVSAEELQLPKEIMQFFVQKGDAAIVRRERATLVAASMPSADEGKIGIGFGSSPAEFFMGEIRKLIHLPALRGNPERNYGISAVGTEYPGNFAEYVASIIHGWQNTRNQCLFKLAHNLKLLGLTWKVQTRPIDDTRVEILVGRLPAAIRGGARDVVSIADVGFGVSQTLPVLVALLAAAPEQFVFIEQPEIHLHPRAQVALADLFLDAINRGVRLIVETHSSLLVLALQDVIARGRLDPNKVSMNWFTRDSNGTTRVAEAEIGSDGSYGEWPIDFGSVELELQARYLNTIDRQASATSATRH